MSDDSPLYVFDKRALDELEDQFSIPSFFFSLFSLLPPHIQPDDKSPNLYHIFTLTLYWIRWLILGPRRSGEFIHWLVHWLVSLVGFIGWLSRFHLSYRPQSHLGPQCRHLRIKKMGWRSHLLIDYCDRSCTLLPPSLLGWFLVWME